MLPVTNSGHYNENSKNSKNRLQANARPSGATPNPRAKTKMQKPQGGGNFWCKSPGGHWKKITETQFGKNLVFTWFYKNVLFIQPDLVSLQTI